MATADFAREELFKTANNDILQLLVCHDYVSRVQAIGNVSQIILHLLLRRFG
jgi:hypothetical protein